MTENGRVGGNEAANRLRDWVGVGIGVEIAEVVEAPVEVPGWKGRPWVRVRCLTEAEALERESLGLIEEYELVTRGLEEPSVSVRRIYDLRAMAEYDFAHTVTDFCLPELRMDQTLAERRAAVDDPDGNVSFLGCLQPAVAKWLQEVIDRVNRRLPEQRATIEQAKKN